MRPHPSSEFYHSYVVSSYVVSWSLQYVPQASAYKSFWYAADPQWALLPTSAARATDPSFGQISVLCR